MSDYLPKPVKKDNLEAMVVKWLQITESLETQSTISSINRPGAPIASRSFAQVASGGRMSKSPSVTSSLSSFQTTPSPPTPPITSPPLPSPPTPTVKGPETPSPPTAGMPIPSSTSPRNHGKRPRTPTAHKARSPSKEQTPRR
jgi:hypothetical protein